MQGLDGAHVVEVAMRDQDRIDRLDPEGILRIQQTTGLLARIDHDCRIGARAPHEVAVLLHRADREHAGVDHRLVAAAFLAIRRRHRNVSSQKPSSR